MTKKEFWIEKKNLVDSYHAREIDFDTYTKKKVALKNKRRFACISYQQTKGGK
jgi:hypothetical protein